VKSKTSHLESDRSGAPTDSQAAGHAPTEVALDSCSDFEWIVVRTKHSVYEIFVVCGKHGSAFVRGGRLFPTFRHATVAGSMIGAVAVALRSIVVGLHLELRIDGKSFVTSRIQSVSRPGGRSFHFLSRCADLPSATSSRP